MENQILRSYEKLGNDVLLLASVRSIDYEVKLKLANKIPKGKLNALIDMQRQEFNQDDIQSFKNPKWLGKAMTGSKSFSQRSLKRSMKTE